jgi:hypothetical protein
VARADEGARQARDDDRVVDGEPGVGHTELEGGERGRRAEVPVETSRIVDGAHREEVLDHLVVFGP